MRYKELMREIARLCRIPTHEPGPQIQGSHVSINPETRIGMTPFLILLLVIPLALPPLGPYGVGATLEVSQTTNITGSEGNSVTGSQGQGSARPTVVNATSISNSSNYGRLNIALYNVTGVVFNVTATALTDDVTAELWVWLLNPSYQEYSCSTAVAMSETVTFCYSLPLAEIRALTDWWIIQLYYVARVLNVPSWEEAGGRVDSVLIQVISAVKLQPVSIDFRSTDGASLFPDRFGVQSMMQAAPALNLSRVDSLENWGIIFGFKSNDTLWLPAGGYAGVGGWFEDIDIRDFQPVSFSVDEDNNTHCAIRITSIRFYIEFSTPVPIADLYLGDYYMFEPFPMTCKVLFLPPGTGGLARLNLRYHDGTYGTGNIAFSTPDEHNLLLDVQIPFFQVAGAALYVPEIIQLIWSCGLLVVLGVRWLLRSRKLTMQAAPVIALALGMVLPWFLNVRYELTTGGAVTTYSLFFPALNSALVWIQDSGFVLLPYASAVVEGTGDWLITPWFITAIWLLAYLAAFTLKLPSTISLGSRRIMPHITLAAIASLVTFFYPRFPWVPRFLMGTIPSVGLAVLWAPPLIWIVRRKMGNREEPPQQPSGS